MTRRRLWVLIVCAALIVLAATWGVQYRRALQLAKESTLKAHLVRMRDAIDQYQRDKGHYPTSLVALVESRYIRVVPEDPFTESAATWRLIPAAATSATAVFDLKSGAPGRASDGTLFSDW